MHRSGDRFVPTSLLPTATVGPVVMALTGIVTMVQTSILTHDLVNGPIAFAIPTVGTTLLAMACAKRRAEAFVGALAAWAVLHLLGAALVVQSGHESFEMLVFFAAVIDAVTLVLATPMLVATGVLTSRTNHDAGDKLLVVAGIWFTALQALPMFFVAEAWAIWLIGLVPALVTTAVGVRSMIRRRRWLARAAEGRMDGYRVRFSDPTDAPLNLPALFGASRAVCVLERLEMTPMPYRGGVITVPIARVPATSASGTTAH